MPKQHNTQVLNGILGGVPNQNEALVKKIMDAVERFEEKMTNNNGCSPSVKNMNTQNQHHFSKST